MENWDSGQLIIHHSRYGICRFGKIAGGVVFAKKSVTKESQESLAEPGETKGFGFER